MDGRTIGTGRRASRAVGLGLALTLAAAAWLASPAAAQTTQPDPLPTASAVLRDSAGRTVGSATLVPATGGVRISARLSGLPPGPHGIHIHTEGRCDPPTFDSAGGHYNPTNREHGLQNPLGPHAGDLPNLTVAADGTATYSALAIGVRLTAGSGSLFKEGGTALVIHVGPDDNVSDPAGNSGDRLACGVIVAGASVLTAPSQVPAALPRTGAADSLGLPTLAGGGAVLLAAGAWLRRRRP